MNLDQIKTKSAFLFDMDGTLIDSEELNHFAFQKVIEENFGKNLSFSEYIMHFLGKTNIDGFISYFESVAIENYNVQEMNNEFLLYKQKGIEENFSI